MRTFKYLIFVVFFTTFPLLQIRPSIRRDTGFKWVETSSNDELQKNDDSCSDDSGSNDLKTGTASPVPTIADPLSSGQSALVREQTLTTTKRDFENQESELMRIMEQGGGPQNYEAIIAVVNTQDMRINAIGEREQQMQGFQKSCFMSNLITVSCALLQEHRAFIKEESEEETVLRTQLYYQMEEEKERRKKKEDLTALPSRARLAGWAVGGILPGIALAAVNGIDLVAMMSDRLPARTLSRITSQSYFKKYAPMVFAQILNYMIQRNSALSRIHVAADDKSAVSAALVLGTLTNPRQSYKQRPVFTMTVWGFGCAACVYLFRK